MNSSRISALEHFARCLVEGARRELALTPKPGLVDRRNNGSHPDLSFALMQASIGILDDYLAAIVRSLVAGEPFACQQQLGIGAERRLYAELGTNTHKGYLFLSSMLLIARWHADADDPTTIRETLSQLAIRFFRTAPAIASNGQRVRDAYQVQGIVGETARGLPALFDIALPAYRRARQRFGDAGMASFAMLAQLMQTVQDTTTLHRAGPLGLHRLHKDGARLERLIADGGDYRAYLVELDRDYIRMNLTMGGVADLVGLSFGHLLAASELGDEADDAAAAAPLMAKG